MPPKESKKSELKKAEKIIDDKTFGLKNKNKSKTVQSYIKGVATQVKQGIVKGGESKRIADEFAEKAAKKKEEEKQALLNSLFKSVKRSQEMDSDNSDEEEEEIEESGEIDLYVDQRDQIYGEDEDGEAKKKNRTEKVCKFFLDAVEANKYGWRWVCPNGRDCIYQHKLPLGFVLKREGNNVVIEDNTPLEEKLEEERAQLTGGTPVTLERFLKWKEDKKIRREKEWEEKRAAEAKKTGTKGLNVLSGRALFKYDPTLFQDDLDAAAVDDYEEEKVEEEEQKIEEGEEGDEEEGEEEGEGEGENAGGEETIQPAEVQADTEGEKTEGDPQAITKKKKKKKKAAKKTEEESEVKINENVFLDQDVELPEDD